MKSSGESVNLCISIFPYLVAIFLAVDLFTSSGLSALLASKLSPILEFFFIPKELTEFITLRPFTGSGSLALISEIYTKYGVDSYISRCASVIMSTSETVFYIIAIYFGTTKIKKLRGIIPIALASIFIGTISACLICRVL
ncbi:MAG: hypothetical protein RR334_02985 [Clostridia bacterium]